MTLLNKLKASKGVFRDLMPREIVIGEKTIALITDEGTLYFKGSFEFNADQLAILRDYLNVLLEEVE